MKKYSVIVIIFFLMLNSAWAKLRNGYEKDIHYVRESLKNYNDILNTNKDLSSSDRRKMKARINEFNNLPISLRVDRGITEAV